MTSSATSGSSARMTAACSAVSSGPDAVNRFASIVTFFCQMRTRNRPRFTDTTQDFSVSGHHYEDMSLLRAVADAAVHPLTLDDLLDHFRPLRGGTGPEQVQGRITAVRAETADSATIEILPGRDWAGHLPGQYVRMSVDVDGVRLWRCYSLTHGPRKDRRISITVKAIPGGTVSNHLVRNARPGQMVQLAQPEGEFVLDAAHRKLLLITGGSGITPVVGMLRNLFSAAEPRTDLDIVLVHSALTHDDVIFGDELRAHA